MFATVYSDDPYGKIFKALDNPDEAKRQLDTLKTQSKGIELQINDLSKTRKEVDDKTKALELHAAEVSALQDKAIAQRDEAIRLRQVADVAHAEADKRAAALNEREHDIRKAEEAVKVREGAIAVREVDLQALHDAATQRHQEALDLKADYEAKVERLNVALR